MSGPRSLWSPATARIGDFEAALAALVRSGAERAIDAFALEAQEAASRWTRLLVEALGDLASDPALRRLVPAPEFVADVTASVMASMLARSPNRSLAATSEIDRALRLSQNLAGPRIVEFTPEAVTAAKQHYLALNETHGIDSRYLARALMNRLKRPWHILRLARALSWKPDDALVRNTEFGVVGERLIRELSQSVDGIAARASPSAAICRI